jgi:hypothetical protein
LSSEVSELDARWAEIDRRLASIQAELVPGRQGRAPGATVGEFTVSAGPFTSTAALRAFEQTLSGIPGVREVSVRSYEGEDRAIVDVRLDQAKP